jgi:hypothetical protein
MHHMYCMLCLSYWATHAEPLQELLNPLQATLPFTMEKNPKPPAPKLPDSSTADTEETLPISSSLPKAIHERVEQLAEANERTFAAQVRLIVKEYFKA